MSPLPDVQVGNDEPLYNIGVVSRMTGLTMATLRAWERRYDFPDAERTAGGHRLYTEQDILQLRWVKARIDEGMQTSHAIQALRHQEQTGHVVMPDVYQAPTDDNGKGAHYLPQFEEHLFEALVNRNLEAADGILGEALAISSPEELILQVISPTFSKIGEAWEQGQVSVAVEHLATNYLRQRLLMWMVNGPPPRRTRPVVLACAPGEWHEGSLLILGALLRRRRWPVAYLGQAVPLKDLAEYIRDIRPALVVLVSMTENSASELIEWPNWFPEASKTGKPVIGYGGLIFTHQPEWRLRMSGTYLGDTLQEGLESIERILQSEAL
jgi:DNA-binding transcriptional MerR regulator